MTNILKELDLLIHELGRPRSIEEFLARLVDNPLAYLPDGTLEAILHNVEAESISLTPDQVTALKTRKKTLTAKLPDLKS